MDARLDWLGGTGQVHRTAHITSKDWSSERKLVAARTGSGHPSMGHACTYGDSTSLLNDQPFMRIERFPSPASDISKSER